MCWTSSPSRRVRCCAPRASRSAAGAVAEVFRALVTVGDLDAGRPAPAAEVTRRSPALGTRLVREGRSFAASLDDRSSPPVSARARGDRQALDGRRADRS
jgi:hypothetical protein